MTRKETYNSVDIRRLLLYLKAEPRYEGFRYAVYALLLLQEDPEYLLAVTKRLYPAIAEYYHTSGTAVERDLRTLIAVVWQHSRAQMERIAGYPLPKRPAVSQFLAYLYSWLKLEGER